MVPIVALTMINNPNNLVVASPCTEICDQTLNYAVDSCMTSIFPPACVGAAGVVWGLCMSACAALRA